MKTYLYIYLLGIFSIGYSTAEELPGDVKLILSQRNDAVKRIDRKFVQELENLKVKYTKAGDLASANAIVNLIKNYSDKTTDSGPSGSGPASPESKFSGEFVSQYGNAYIVTFPATGGRASVERRGTGGKNTNGTASLRDDGRELALSFEDGKGEKKEATMIHIEGDRFHWFEDGNMRAKPILMTKRAKISR